MRLFPSELAAREARADEAQARRARGEQLWQPTPTQSLARWFEQQWLSQWPLQQLFNQTQLLAVWLAVVEADDRPLIAPRACARLALAADQLAHRYGLDPERGSAYTEEQQAFRRWRREAQRRLQALDGISAAELPARIATPATPLPLPLSLQPAAAWPTLSPVERDSLQRCGATPPPAPPAAVLPVARRYADASQQYRGLAEALREAYPQASADGPRRILLALPDPEGARPSLEAALVDVLAPWARNPGLAQRLPWRWARGRALAETAAADALLGLARLDLAPRPLADWQTLLLHPALGLLPERLEAARLERELRDEGIPRIRLGELVARARPPLRDRLQRLEAQLQKAPARALPGSWGGVFLERYRVLRPVQLAEDSRGFQIERALSLACGRLSGLDRLLGPLPAAAVLPWLRDWLTPPFSARVEHPQPLLIGRPEDLLGIRCDLLILADYSADAWLNRRSPNPFLNLDLQRQAGVPEARPEASRERLRAQLDSLCAAADAVWVSLPAVDARGAELLPGPWLSGLRDTPTPVTQGTAALETPAQDPVPPVTAAEALTASAGTFERVLRAPLLGVVVDRLGSTPLPPRPRGLSAAVQGALLHAVLARVWGELESDQGLAADDDEALIRRLQTAVTAEAALLLPPGRYSPSLITLELGRAVALLQQWLRHERRRCDAYTVIARESELTGHLDGLPVRLRLDRADRVETPLGPRVLLIDYKTGRDADPRGWADDRLSSPQLPLYAVLARQQTAYQPLGGIAFAHLKPGHPALSARCDWRSTLIDAAPLAVDSGWPEQLARWQAQLGIAARELLAGAAGGDVSALNPHEAAYAPLFGVSLDAEDEA
jgi:ATP-dependent helicase/nuclease subunit B